MITFLLAVINFVVTVALHVLQISIKVAIQALKISAKTAKVAVKQGKKVTKKAAKKGAEATKKTVRNVKGKIKEDLTENTKPETPQTADVRDVITSEDDVKDKVQSNKGGFAALRKLQLLKILQKSIHGALVLSRVCMIAVTIFVFVLTSLLITSSFAIISSAGYVALAYNNGALGKEDSDSSFDITKDNSDSDSSTSAVTNYKKSTSTEDILKLSEKEVYLLLSKGKISNYEDANAIFKRSRSELENIFGGSNLKTVEVPAWQWVDRNDYSKGKKKGKVKMTVNKNLTEFFTDFMTELYNLPEQYVIEQGTFGGYVLKNKKNSPNVSGHSFGATLDINWQTDGMRYGQQPWATLDGLKEPYRSMCCTIDSDWYKLAKRYHLEWGGTWGGGGCDPMHFSLVGDNTWKNRHEPTYAGRKP